MRLLITGGNIDISKIIKNHLLSKFKIIILERDAFSLLDYNSVKSYLTNNSFDVLIHTSISGGRRTMKEEKNIVYENLLMFENLVKFADKFKLIINFDSGAIYDRSTNIYCRDEPELFTIPTDYYGFSKYLIYKRSLQYKNIVNFRIFNIFHVNEEPDRFVKSCFLAKKNGTPITIFQDKYFDFMYEDDFVKIIKYYIDNYSSKLPKTFNLSYTNKYKLSDIANIILNNKEQILIKDNSCSNNYCGDGTVLDNLSIGLDGLEASLKKYEALFL